MTDIIVAEFWNKTVPGFGSKYKGSYCKSMISRDSFVSKLCHYNVSHQVSARLRIRQAFTLIWYLMNEWADFYESLWVESNLMVFLTTRSSRFPLKSLYSQRPVSTGSDAELDKNQWFSAARGSCAGSQLSESLETIPRQCFWTIQSNLASLRGSKSIYSFKIRIWDRFLISQLWTTLLPTVERKYSYERVQQATV